MFAAAHLIAAAGVEDFLVVVSVAWAPRAADPSIYPLIAIDMFPSQKVVDFELLIYMIYTFTDDLYTARIRHYYVKLPMSRKGPSPL